MSQHARNNPDQPPLHEAFKGAKFSPAPATIPPPAGPAADFARNREFAIRDAIINHCGTMLTPDRVDTIVRELVHEVEAGNMSWAFKEPHAALTARVSQLEGSLARADECLTTANFGSVPKGWDDAIARAEKAEEQLEGLKAFAESFLGWSVQMETVKRSLPGMEARIREARAALDATPERKTT